MKASPAKEIMRAAKKGASFLSLSVFLLVQVMAAIPAFHAWAHQDARDPSHECAVTLFLHGQIHAPATEVEVTKPPPGLFYVAQPCTSNFKFTDLRLLPSRGPPA
jgi:hypothetical protein